MRDSVIAANWKMNLGIDEARELAIQISASEKKVANREIILFPSFLQITAVHEAIKDSEIGLGAQDVHFEDKGAFTGEVAAFQLVEAGCSHVLIGHSERRHYFREDYETVNKKMLTALRSGLKVMLCVGESLEERENCITEMVVVDQVVSAFEQVPEKELENIYVAYEPIWAIGTGKTATTEDAAHVHEIIRKTLKRSYSEEAAEAMRILYGGSVKPDNIKSLLANEQIDGALVGGASLKHSSFDQLINA